MLDSKKTKNTGCVFLPLSLAVEKSSSSKTRDVGDDLKKHVVCNGTLWDVLRFLKDSFDCIDITRKPFKWGGTNSEGIVDFTHYRTKEFKARWSDSCAFYLSLGGDTLLVDRDGAVAWHQLETGRIIPVGRIEEAIKRYLDFTIADEEFSSWTDNGQE